MAFSDKVEFEIPKGFEVAVAGKKVTVKHAGKSMEKTFNCRAIDLSVENGKVIIHAHKLNRKLGSTIKTVAARIKSMFKGLEHEYVYKMEIVYSHFPMNVTLKGNTMEITNLCGGKSPRKASILPGVKVEIKGKEIIATGNDKEIVSQTCANIENATKLVGRDRRVFQDGIYIVSKGK
jgi:large subunit ribosomal protein L6